METGFLFNPAPTQNRAVLKIELSRLFLFSVQLRKRNSVEELR
jgi:hypothetical protein